MKKVLSFLIAFIIASGFPAAGFAGETNTANVINVTASISGDGVPGFTVDGDLMTSYALLGAENIWFLWELDKVEIIESLSIAFLAGDVRSSIFDIEVSKDGKNFTKVMEDVYSSGETIEPETFSFDEPVEAKFIKYVGYGNTASDWNNISEFTANLKASEGSIAGGNGSISSGSGAYVPKVDYITANSLILQTGNKNALNSGLKITLPDTAPYVTDSRTYVPVRFVAECFDAQVLWDEDTHTVACITADNVIKFVINKSSVEINGVTSAIDAKAQLIGGRTMVPLRALAEAFGKKVMWEEAGGLIFISDIALPKPCVCEVQTLSEMLK